jgi:hypothetical protein
MERTVDLRIISDARRFLESKETGNLALMHFFLGAKECANIPFSHQGIVFRIEEEVIIVSSVGKYRFVREGERPWVFAWQPDPQFNAFTHRLIYIGEDYDVDIETHGAVLCD